MYYTEHKGQCVAHFFDPRTKNRIYASDNPASERTKFVCAVNIYASNNVPNSVDDIEWVCRSCHKYLSHNKVPPCAAVNGMQFPPKPALFDLNDLRV